MYLASGRISGACPICMYFLILNLGSHPSQNRKGDRKEEKSPRFSTAEAFTHILSRWVDDLEKLGVIIIYR
jgi:hypothetical protein